MRYDRFRSRCEAAGHLPARGDRRFCRAARSQMGFSELAPASVEATKWLGDRHGGCPRHFGRWPASGPAVVAGRPSPAPLGPVYPAGSALGGGWGLLWPYRSRVVGWCLHAVLTARAPPSYLTCICFPLDLPPSYLILSSACLRSPSLSLSLVVRLSLDVPLLGGLCANSLGSESLYCTD